MTTDTRTTALDYYAAHGCALFPMPAGSKAPTGIVASFKHDHSTDPAQWAAWSAANPNCNFGVVAFASRLIIVDIDTSGPEGRDAAWSAWCALCTEWGLSAPLAPHVQSARGGWHVYVAVPPHVDASQLRQPDAIKKRINVRCVGYTVAAGSYYDGTAKGEQSGPYLLLSHAPPHPCPEALLAHCTRAPRADRLVAAPTGQYDFEDVKKLYAWMTEHGGFEAYEDWLTAGMVAKAEFGDAGITLWELTHDGTVTPDTETSKWNSFAADTTSDSVTLSTILKRAHSIGWKGSVRPSTSSMFDGVAAIAAAAGATLHSARAGIPLADTAQIVAALGQPVLDNFLAGTKDAPLRPLSNDFPTLPDTVSAHPLYTLLLDAIPRIVAMAEGGSKSFRQSRVLPVLAVLSGVHPTVCEHLCQRITAIGGVLSPGDLDSAIRRFEGKVHKEIRTAAGFALNNKNQPDAQNSDNVHVFLRQRGVKFRTNTLLGQIEISEAEKDEFNPLTDEIFDGLLVDAENSQFNYHPSESAFRRGITAAASIKFDPLRDTVDTLAEKWDGTARLDNWLHHTVGTPLDIYHTAVGRNLIGGMVRRARQPGCDQAETVIFISPDQGMGKSKICKILARNEDWYTDSFKLGGSQQNTLPQLASKWIVEMADLAGMNKTDVEEIKNFMTINVDEYVAKYAKFPTKQPRRCVFIGTSNDKRPLIDSTGNRRFLPVHVVGEVNLDWLRANVDQIIGECAARDALGESFFIPRDVWKITSLHQEAARTMTPVEEHCQEWFAREGSFFITATDIGRALKMAGQSQHARYASFLDKMGWRSENLVVPGDGRKCRVWVLHANNALGQCVRLVPAQAQVNGPVEMRPTLPRGPMSPLPLLPLPY